jgi:hypothetical protein
MLKSRELLEEIKNVRREFQELKLLQLKLVEYMIPLVKPTKKEESVIRNMNKMKFYSLKEVKRRLKI